jgi:rhamnopyranosyl-N-acetylglucosaminyl-diphospho-decaprenol beta-1,3/1,4-galactofuranosyltransferase
VVVTYNNAEMLRRLLESILSQSYKPDEVIVIDNASGDSTQEVVQGFLPAVRYVRHEQNMGSAGGYYEGIRLASQNNDAVWLLDDDVALEPQSLQELIKQFPVLAKTARIGAMRSWCTKECPFSAPRRIQSFAWRGTMITKEAIEAIGLPRQEYFLYGDDVEYALRMVRKGFAIYWIPASKVMEQRQDDKQRIRFGKAKARIYRDKFRLYYAFRNQVHLGFWHHQWWFLIRTLLYAAKVSGMLFSAKVENRKEKLRAVIDGIGDGFKARLGNNKKYIL